MTTIKIEQLRELIEQVRVLIECIEPLPSGSERDEVIGALNRYVAHLITVVDETSAVH